MKTGTFKTKWLIPLLGIGAAGGGYLLIKSYLGYQEQLRSGEQYSAIVDRAWQACDLSKILAEARYSGCTSTARTVDELLSTHLASDSYTVASADPDAKALVEVVIKYVDRRRAESLPVAKDLVTGPAVLAQAPGK